MQDSGMREPAPKIQYIQQAAPSKPTGGGGSFGSMGMIVVMLVIAAVVSYFMIPFMGASKADVTTLNTSFTTLSTNNAALEARLRAVESRPISSIPDLSSYARASELNSYAKAGDLSTTYYSKTQVDEILKGYVKVGTSTTTTTTGTGTVTTGGYTITTDKAQIISMASETGNKDVSVTIVNNTGASKIPSLIISLIPLSPGTFATSELDTNLTGTHHHLKSTLSGFTTAAAGTVQANTDVATLLSKVYWITPTFSLDNGASKSIWLNFDVWTTNVVTWSLTIKALE